jgi:inorganic pyrophosphatase
MSYSKIPAGKDLPNDIYVAIEIPANHAPIKYEIDKDSDCLFVDRFMATPMSTRPTTVTSRTPWLTTVIPSTCWL